MSIRPHRHRAITAARFPVNISLFEPLEPRRFLSSYFFSPTGSDSSGNGTEQHPWATLVKADKLTLHPGDDVLFQGGKTFFGNLRLGASGTASDPITIESYGSTVATIDATSGVGIFAHDCGGLTIANLRLVGPGRDKATADGIQFLNDLAAGDRLSAININEVDVSGFTNGIELDAMPKNGVGKNGYDNVRITNSTLHDDAINGIFTQGNFSQTSKLYSFTNVQILYDSAYSIYHHADGTDTEDGIQLSDVNGGLIDHCVAHDNGLSGNGEVGIWAWDSNKITIQFCTSYRNHTGRTDDGDGFDLDGGDTNCLVQYNHSYDNDGAGYALFQFQYARPYSNNIVRYNSSVDDGRKNQYGAIDLWNGNGSEGISNCLIYGNTVHISPSPGASPSAIQFEDLTTGILVEDNKFFTTGGVPLVDILTSQTKLAFKGNQYSSGTGAFRIIQKGKTYHSVAQWNAATGQEGNGTPITG